MGRHGLLIFGHRAGCSIAALAVLYDKQRLETKHSRGKKSARKNKVELHGNSPVGCDMMGQCADIKGRPKA
jgi:hypothetical protein